MSFPILPFLSSRLPAFAWMALLFASASAIFAADTAIVASPPVPPPVPQPAAGHPAEGQDALLARLSKVLNYGSDLSLSKPSKADVVIALGVIGDERAVPVLAEHLANNDNKFLRLRIVRALGWIGGQQVILPLETALKDEYPSVRKQAADVLRQLTGRSYEFDKTGVSETHDLSALEASLPANENRLETIAVEVSKRRELRQLASGGTASQEKKKMVEPVDIVIADLPVREISKTFSDLTGKLVLTSPKVSALTVSCKIEKASRVDAQAALQKALKEVGVQVVELERGVIAFIPADSAKSADKPLKP